MYQQDFGVWYRRLIPQNMSLNILFMKKYQFVFLSMVMAIGCSTPMPLMESVRIPAEFPVKDTTRNFLIIDAAEVMTTGIAIVKRREAVLQDVKAEYLRLVPELFETQLSMKAVIDTSVTEDQKKRILAHERNILDSLRSRHNAEIIVVFLNCYGGFEKDDVVTEKNDDGSKSKTAYYSVFFESTWKVIQNGIDKQKIIMARKPHSNRPIVSGLLARGPGFKANKKDILEMARDNAYNFTGLFQDRVVNMQVPVKRN
jgi:hypothetical protein